MNLTGSELEGQPHPASEEADIFERMSEPSYEKDPPKDWETETRYITRFEEKVFNWVRDQKRGGVHVTEDEISLIFNNFFDYISKHPVFPIEKQDDPSKHQITPDNLTILVDGMRSHARHGETDPYIGTSRGRNFLFPEASAKPYVKTLFGIGEDVFLSDRNKTPNSGVMKYLGSKINGKRILNIGGKNMTKDLLTKEDLKPKCVVNLDPFIDSEDSDMNQKGIYRSINISASDAKIGERLLNEGVPNQYDEVWASFSVPVYLNTTGEIDQFFSNITGLLSEKGVARIFPLSVQLREEDDLLEERAIQGYFVRKKCLMDNIVNLSRNEKFSVDVISTHESPSGPVHALLIQRLK